MQDCDDDDPAKIPFRPNKEHHREDITLSPVGPGMNVSYVQMPRGGADQDGNEFDDNSDSHTVS